MELKLVRVLKESYDEKFDSHLYGIETFKVLSLSALRSLFESHLYGIETVPGSQHALLYHRLNRTFMELKLCLHSQSATASRSFESHLYGIETLAADDDVVCRLV